MNKLQEFFIKYPAMKWLITGLSLGFFALGVYALGAIVVCHESGGIAVGGILPTSCIAPKVLGVCEYQGGYYVPNYENRTGYGLQINASSFNVTRP